MPRSANVRVKRSGRYEARYYDPAGNRRGKTFASEAEAKAFLRTVENAVQVGDYIAPEAGRVTFGAVAGDWLRKKEQAGCKARTLDGYAFILRTWLARWEDRPIGAITRTDVDRLLEDLAARRPQTARNVFNVASGVFRLAVKRGNVRANPCDVYRDELPKQDRRETVQPLTPHDVARLAGECAAPYDLLVTFAAWSGLRRGEIAGLRVGRLDLTRSEVTVCETVIDLPGGEQRLDTPKSERSRRTVPIPPPLAALLREHVAGLAPDAFVFGNDDGTPLHAPRWYQRVFKPAARRAGLPHVRFHDLRHTYASLMAHQGEDIYRLSRWMGHSTIAITVDLYTHLYKTEDQALQERSAAAFLAAQQAPANVVSLATKRTG